MRVAAAVVGVGSSAAAAGVAGSPAYAATTNYQINVHYSALGVSDFYVCGYNQSNKWKCSNDYSNLIYGPFGWMESKTVPNWWWHGKVRVWWDHGSKHASCTIPTPATSGSWTSIWADSQTAFGTGDGNCRTAIG